MSHRYSLTYTVTAPNELEAIRKAASMLRSGVRLRGVNSVTRASGNLWRVSLNLSEDA